MKNQFRHINHQFNNIPHDGFLILNKFKADIKNPSLKNIIRADLLNEDYFSTEEQKIQTDKQLDQLISIAKRANAYEVNGNENIELYGPILKDKIKASDFKKLTYNEYLMEMQKYIMEWTDEGWYTMAKSFQIHHHYALKELQKLSAENRDYYFLNAESVEENRLYEVNWYDYFFCVVSTLKSSDNILIMNYGND